MKKVEKKWKKWKKVREKKFKKEKKWKREEKKVKINLSHRHTPKFSQLYTTRHKWIQLDKNTKWYNLKQTETT